MIIQSKLKDYEIVFSRKEDFVNELSTIQPRVIIVDKNVLEVYKTFFLDNFKSEEIIPFEAIEENKNITSVLNLCDKVMGFSAKKNMSIISFGGGITQDVTGFLASILYRGVNWIFIPTTLLAQADSCMGSKTSLNHKHFKNLLGDFFPPTKVYVDPQFTQSLSETDFFSGIGEVVKLHLMGGKNSFESIIANIDEIKQNKSDANILSKLIHTSLSVKYSYIKDDEFDTGKRNLLNYGHCFGHALESSSEYKIPHGIAVIIGMMFANIIAVKRNLLTKDIEQTLFHHVLKKCILYDLTKKYFQYESILSAMKMDKKRIGEGLPLIVLKTNLELTKLLDLTPEELQTGLAELSSNLFL